MESSSPQSNFLHDESAVSEIVGFLIVLTVVTLAIGIITVGVNPLLEKTRNDVYMQNMEDSFRVLQQRMLDVALDDAPTKTSGIALHKGIIVFDPDAVNITVNVTNANSTRYIKNASLGRLSYESVDRGIVLEGGALMARYGQASVVKESPPIYKVYSDDTLVIMLVDLEGLRSSISGSGNLDVIARYNASSSTYVSGLRENVSLSLKSPNAAVWEKELAEQGFTVMRTGDTVNATYTDTFVRVKHCVIDISLEGTG